MHAAPAISPFTLAFFRHIVRGYFRRHFRAVRVSHPERMAALSSGPLLIYANHSSWWDPMVSVLLGATLLTRRRHFAPMDALALERYKILKRVGVFPVEMKTARGAAQFLRTGLEVLRAGGVLWITPQGRFADARERPLVFKPGLAALATRVPGCTVLPLAIEYTFWDERLPETLLHFGEPITVDGQTTTEALDARLKACLLATMTELEAKAMTRDPAQFELLQSGHTGTGGFYEFGRRAMAKLRRRPYVADHTPARPLPLLKEEQA